MANTALVIGWGPAVQGHEQKALQVFGEAIQYYTRLQQQGQIDSPAGIPTRLPEAE